MLEDANIPRDQVISQTPSANAGLDEPAKVDLMVSSGAPGKSLTMPEVAGRTVAEAKAALRVLGVTDITLDPADSLDICRAPASSMRRFAPASTRGRRK